MPFTIDYAGKLVLITGGGRGLGHVIATRFAEAGANLALTYNSTPADEFASELEKKYGIKAAAFKMPAEDSKIIASTLKAVTEKLGEPDVLVANAGVLTDVDAAKTSDQVLKHTFEVNAFSPFYLAREAFNLWFPDGKGKKDKSIVIVGSISAHIHNQPVYHLAYNASKAAVVHIAKGLALEWAKNGVRVNLVSPSYMETDMVKDADPKLIDLWKSLTPTGRLTDPDEVAHSIVFLASQYASGSTGSDLLVDGGYTIP